MAASRASPDFAWNDSVVVLHCRPKASNGLGPTQGVLKGMPAKDNDAAYFMYEAFSLVSVQGFLKGYHCSKTKHRQYKISYRKSNR